MYLWRKLKAFFRREADDPSASPRAPFVPAAPSVPGERPCPKCGSTDTTLRMTEWIIGYQVQDNGRTAFACVCNACGQMWEYLHNRR
jgi:DNA-directed RNA polymerase subunit M/transcription elongation factor TFIIS